MGKFIQKLCNIFLMLAVIFFATQACSQTKTAAQSKSVFRVSDQTVIGYSEMIDDLRRAEIVFVGESHDNQAHHRLQLEIIEVLHNSGKPLAVGFEMFTAKNQAVLDKWIAGALPQDQFIKAYYENWNFPWPLYRDILLYVRENKIPAIGLNVEPAITRKVAKFGFSALTKEELAELPPDIGCAVDKDYMNFIRRVHAMHEHGSSEFVYFCQAQLLWDQVMARNIVGFLRENPGRTVVVITGNGHAWKRGIPEQVRLLSDKIRFRVILPIIPGHIEASSIGVSDADYLLSP